MANERVQVVGCSRREMLKMTAAGAVVAAGGATLARAAKPPAEKKIRDSLQT